MTYHTMREFEIDSRWDAMRDEYEPTRYCDDHDDEGCYECKHCSQCDAWTELDEKDCCKFCAAIWCEVCQATDCRMYAPQYQQMERHCIPFRGNPKPVPHWWEISTDTQERIEKKLAQLATRVNRFVLTPETAQEFIRLESAFYRLNRYASGLWK